MLDQGEAEPLDLSSLRALPAYRAKPWKSRKEARKKLKLQRRRERRRRLRVSQDSLAASYAGLTLQLAGGAGGGERKRLQWGRRGSARPQPPPFDMLLSSVEEGEDSSLVPHTSGELRTETSSDSEAGHHKLTFSQLPSSRSRPPPPLRDSQADHQQQLRNYKRRRHQS